MGRPSAFKTDAARAEYCRLYDEAIGLSEVPVAESSVETSFGSTHVLTAGDPSKPPLVALHGLMMSSTMWLPLLPALTATHHVWMLDAVGDLNKSVATGALSSPARVVGWIDEVLEALKIERTALLALSLGSWMATHYAMARPDRVERLAMLGGHRESPAHEVADRDDGQGSASTYRSEGRARLRHVRDGADAPEAAR